jgi:DNA-binding CsgD family transcriptional regulator
MLVSAHVAVGDVRRIRSSGVGHARINKHQLQGIGETPVSKYKWPARIHKWGSGGSQGGASKWRLKRERMLFSSGTRRLAALVLLTLCCTTSCARTQSGAEDENLRKLWGTAVNGRPSPEVVHQIALTKKNNAVRILVAVAMTPTAASENRDTAIDELSKIGNAEATEGIAELLAPHQYMTIREHAARAIQGSNCSERCIELVLFYLYRLSSGEVALRERLKNKSVQQQILQAQNQVVANLHTTLVRHRAQTLSALAAIYGLGTEEPSQFAIKMVEQLQLTEACDLLLRSEEQQQRLTLISNSDPTDTKSAIRQLGCQRQTTP